MKNTELLQALKDCVCAMLDNGMAGSKTYKAAEEAIVKAELDRPSLAAEGMSVALSEASAKIERLTLELQNQREITQEWKARAMTSDRSSHAASVQLKCPACGGDGQNYSDYADAPIAKMCDRCQGRGVIEQPSEAK